MTTDNSLPDLCEFKVRLENDIENDNLLRCLVDLRVHSGEIPLGDEECEVCFTKLTISVDLEGLEDPHERYGDTKRENDVPLDKATLNSTKNSSSKKRGMKLPTSKKDIASFANYEVAKSNEQASSECYISNEKREHQRVHARPNLRWEVTEYGYEALDTTYLKNDILFETKRPASSNRECISMEVKVKQRDLAINQIMATQSAVKFFSKLETNRRRLVDIFIAKSISSAIYNGHTYIGEIVISKFDHTDEN